MSFEQIKAIAAGNSISMQAPDQFIRSITSLNVSIEPTLLNIKERPIKILNGNEYLPPFVSNNKRHDYKKEAFTKFVEKYS